MKFQNEQHKQRFAEFIKKDRMSLGDVERKALFYLLSSDILSNLADKAYDFKDRCIKLDNINNTFASGEIKLIKLGYNLYNGYNENITPIDIFSNLDKENFELALEAIRIRFKKDS